jgi:hypothetical protein
MKLIIYVVIFVFKGILNFAIPLDVVLLDRVAQVFLAGSGLEVSLISHVKRRIQFYVY